MDLKRYSRKWDAALMRCQQDSVGRLLLERPEGVGSSIDTWDSKVMTGAPITNRNAIERIVFDDRDRVLQGASDISRAYWRVGIRRFDAFELLSKRVLPWLLFALQGLDLSAKLLLERSPCQNPIGSLHILQ